ncbi:hypothetical protein FRC06_002418 [Ceratobasidium sp. 370]|nr:hypothetical protein FRC06_002418 [Ceratobasidium sp. 370]
MPEITQQLRRLDIHIDTPTEILHTLLLGITKYLWVEAVRAMDKNKQFELFCTRLRSVPVAGLNSDRPIPDYICTNRGSLNGKHFKILAQTIAFCLYGLVPEALRTAWSPPSRPLVLTWYSSIDDLPTYIAELETSVQVLLHDLAKCAPQLLLDKAKVHLLVHLRFFVLRFGPLVGPDTERYDQIHLECLVAFMRFGFHKMQKLQPVLLQDDLVVTTVQNVLGVINLQHRCAFAACTDAGRVIVRQERQDTNITRNTIQHTDNVNFVVNIHSMHNYKLIKELLNGRFSLQAQLEEPAAQNETRRLATQQVRHMRQKENTEHCTENSHAGQSSAAAPEGSSTGRKKRKRQEKSGAGAPLYGDTAGAGPSNATPGTSDSTQPAAYQTDNIYAPPVYPNDDLLNDDLFNDEGAPPVTDAPHPAPDSNQVPNTTAQGELNANGRRNHSDSESDTEENARLERRAFMETLMDEHNIQGSTRQLGHYFADLDPSRQLMYMFSFSLAQQSRTDNLAASDFLRSEIYKTHVVGRIKVAMLLPWTSNYVTLLNHTLIADILRSPNAWRVPEAVISQTEQWQHFTGEFKVSATQVRSQNKITLYRMRDKGADINESARAVAPRGMVIKESHRARLAWIMLASVEFDELVEACKQQRGKFWEWIGSELVALKKRIQHDPRYPTDQERRTAISRVFTRALAKHREQFPPLAPIEPPQPRPGWQETLEAAMDMGGLV